jgi:hypothetical protein
MRKSHLLGYRVGYRQESLEAGRAVKMLLQKTRCERRVWGKYLADDRGKFMST